MSDDKEYVKALSYVRRSKNRTDVVKIIGRETTEIPSRIAEEMGLRINQISAVLKDLKENDIVLCINEEAIVGRLYELTDTGLKVYDFLKDKK